MNRIFKLGALAAIAVSGSLIATFSYSGDYGEYGGMYGYRRQHVDVPPVGNETYVKECGSCHFAYQPGWLPTRSWQAIMSQLDDHFGDNAELDEETHKQVLDYLVSSAGDQGSSQRAARFRRVIAADATPLRIPDATYFRRKHYEIPPGMVRSNPDVGSFSNCKACHTRAETGSFNEHEIRIPGYRRWED